MKKNFFKKKLASALALALVVASFSPAGISAQAATATKIVKQGGGAAPAVLYVGGSKVDYSLSTIKSGVKYTWKSSNTKIATITATTGVVTAKAPGSVTITATATNKKTGKVLNTFKKTLTVNLRSTSVELGDDFTLATGETKKLAAALTPSNSTDVINYVSSDKAVATVGLTGGVVTGKEAGEATITVYAKATKASANKSTKTKVDTVKVTVPVGVTEAKQVAENAITLTFNANVKDKVKASDLVLKDAKTNAIQAIKSISFSEDGKTVTATTYLSLSDKAEYSLTYAEKEFKFTASVGAVAAVSIKTTQVPFNVETEIEYDFFDANGIKLTSVDSNKVSVDVETSGGYTTDVNGVKKINLTAKGNTAVVTVTYHTWTYKDGAEVTVSAKGTITAVDPSEITIGAYEKYTIVASGSAVDWTKDAVTTVSLSDVGSKINLHVKNSSNKYIAASDITFKPADATILAVDPDGTLYPVKEGSTYVIATTGKASFTLPVTVVKERSAGSIALDKSYATISNTTAVTDTAVVAVTVKDQYGNDYSAVATATPNTAGAPVGNYANGKITFTAQGATAGTYGYTIEAAGKKTGFTLKVENVGTVNVSNLTTKLIVSTNAVDTKITSSTSLSSKDVTIKLARYNNNVLYDYDTAAVQVATNGGIVSTLTPGAENVYTFNTVTADATNKITKAANGLYTITVTRGTDVYRSYVQVTDTQTLPSVTVDKVTSTLRGDVTVANDVLTIKNASGTPLTVIATDSVVAQNYIVLKSVTVTEVIGSYTVDVVVPLANNVSITLK
ncbi:Ig-like domain-containing protein [Clostridium sp. KNHs205]|jgi:hypothetical protein|uniref:Ig-like domain-containing protein n=1 Tax=Clostridium sp. KNHs205 TaxID=1449050 RepID=UPI00051AE04C|nr:Ig-like domain-containing protein [Clostridium sp. KNHs205]